MGTGRLFNGRAGKEFLGYGKEPGKGAEIAAGEARN